MDTGSSDVPSLAETSPGILSPIRNLVWGDALLSMLLLAAYVGLAFATLYLLRWAWRFMNGSGEAVASWAQGENQVLPAQKPSVVWRLISVLAVLGVYALIMLALAFAGRTLSAGTIPMVLLGLSAFILPVHHAFTLRRFAREVAAPSMKTATADAIREVRKMAA